MARPDPYDAFEAMIAPARHRPEIWRVVLGVMLAFSATFFVVSGVLEFARLVMAPGDFMRFATAVQTGSTPFGVLMILVATGAIGLCAMIAVRLLHDRPPETVFGPVPRAIAQFFGVLWAVALLYMALSVLFYLTDDTALTPGLPVGQWVAYLPLTILALLIQTGGEEVLFRGYLQPQFAALSRNRLVWMVLPSALFGAVHYAPAIYGTNAPVIALWAFVFGLVTADLTARAGTLGPAMALHLANNFFAIALTSLAGDLSGLALFTLPYGPEDEAAIRAVLPLDFIGMLLCWLAARIAIRA